jgi:hypothetical protein
MYTHHAEVRCKQRGIRPEVVETILAYGRQRRRHGADVYFMDSSSRKRARSQLGRIGYARIADRLDAYLVMSDDGQMVTAAIRLRKLMV